MCQNFKCSQTTGCCSSSFCIKSAFPLSVSALSVRNLLRGCFPSPVSPSLSTVFISVMGTRFSPFRIKYYGLMAGLPGYASPWSGLHPGACWQQWKLLLDVSGTQPPLWEVVVKLPIGTELTSYSSCAAFCSRMYSFSINSIQNI